MTNDKLQEIIDKIGSLLEDYHARIEEKRDGDEREVEAIVAIKLPNRTTYVKVCLGD